MLVQDKNITVQTGLIFNGAHSWYMVFCVTYFDNRIDDSLTIEVMHQAMQIDPSVLLLFELNQAIRE